MVMMLMPSRRAVVKRFCAAGGGCGIVLRRLLRHRMVYVVRRRSRHDGSRELMRSLVEDGETKESAGPLFVAVWFDVRVVLLLVVSFHANENARSGIRRRGSEEETRKIV